MLFKNLFKKPYMVYNIIYSDPYSETIFPIQFLSDKTSPEEAKTFCLTLANRNRKSGFWTTFDVQGPIYYRKDQTLIPYRSEKYMMGSYECDRYFRQALNDSDCVK